MLGRDGAIYLFLVLGDYSLSLGKNVEATRHYVRSQAAWLDNRPGLDWGAREAACNVQKIRNERATARLEPTCEHLSSLQTGR